MSAVSGRQGLCAPAQDRHIRDASALLRSGQLSTEEFPWLNSIGATRRPFAAEPAHGSSAIDQGLRAFMLGIYNNMAIGLALTGLVAYGALRWRDGPSRRPGRLTAFGSAIYSEPAALGDHPRAARLRVRPVGDREPHAAVDGAARLPRLRGGDGPVDVVDLPRLHATRASRRPSSSRRPRSAR